MKAVSGKRFCKLLEANGWTFERINGSHYVYSRPGVPFNISVPVHANRDLKAGMQKGLMKQGGLTEEDL